MTDSSAVSLLATTAGIAGIVLVILNASRRIFDAATFDRWAALIAIVLGVVLAELYVVAAVQPLTSTALLGGLVSGILGGALSQNANTALTRVTKTT